MSMSPATGIQAELLTEKPREKEIPLEFSKEARYYFCTVSAASFIRPDGKKVPFVDGVCITNIQGDIDYLEKEMKNGNQHIRLATDAEIRMAMMKINPKEALRQEIIAEAAPQIETDLRAKIFAELAAKGIDTSILEQKAPGMDAAKVAGTVAAKPIGNGVTITAPVPVGASFAKAIVGTDKIAPAAAG